MCSKTIPIRIRKETVEELKRLKLHPRETYDDVIRRLIANMKTSQEEWKEVVEELEKEEKEEEIVSGESQKEVVGPSESIQSPIKGMEEAIKGIGEVVAEAVEIMEKEEKEEVSAEKEDLKELLRKEVELTEEEMRLHGHVKVSEEDRARIGDEIVKILSEKGALMPKELLKELIDRGFSPRKSERIMAELVKKGVIEVCEVEMGKWGKQSFLRLKEK